jgi:protein-L-isoaspartate(D-aspartate) O-methyltransferase
MNNSEIAKFNMIEQQIRPWEVLDHQVLSTLDQLNREDFVQQAYKGLAYADCQIPLVNGVRMLPPTVEGRLLQALLIDADDLVLEVGCGSGYVTACLAQLAGQVTSIDADAEIVDLASANVAKYGLDNVEFESMSPAQLDAPERYDAIAVTASLPWIPQNLKQALKSGGRMFVIVGDSPVMEALLVTRVSTTEWITQSLFETDLPRLKLQVS